MSQCKKIVFFNHKGGVSKTTTVFNVGWMLATKGKKVIMVDADSQYNKPVFSLTQADIKQSGAVWTGSKEKIASFKELFSNLADSIVRMTNAEC